MALLDIMGNWKRFETRQTDRQTFLLLMLRVFTSHLKAVAVIGPDRVTAMSIHKLHSGSDIFFFIFLSFLLWALVASQWEKAARGPPSVITD